jgi:Glycosyl transferase 4-like domain
MVKKVLLVSYHFPPSAEVGGLRVANFSKWLSRFGWTPFVLTLKDDHLENLDLEKLKRVGSVSICKAGLMPTLSSIYVRIKVVSQRVFGRSRTACDAEGGTRRRVSGGCNAESLSQKIRRYILSFLSLPDEQRNWMWPAVIQGARIIRREKIDCIITSSPPYSVHLVGWVLKFLTGVCWVADFRDPWMTGGSKRLYVTCALSLSIERWIERQVIKSADLVVANTELLCETFRKAYGAWLPDRFVCLTNGFDGELFSAFDHVEKNKVFTIIYAGTLYFGRTPEPVFQAIHELKQDGLVDVKSIRIRLVGQCRVINARPIEEIIREYELNGIVEVLDSVSYFRSIEMVKQSHLALLLAPNQPYQIPAKAYDYIGAGTAILALAGEGATSDLIRSTGVGAAFEQADIAGIKEFILRSMASQHIPPSELTMRAVAMYEMRAIVRKLALHLDSLRGLEKQQS